MADKRREAAAEDGEGEEKVGGGGGQEMELRERNKKAEEARDGWVRFQNENLKQLMEGTKQMRIVELVFSQALSPNGTPIDPDAEEVEDSTYLDEERIVVPEVLEGVKEPWFSWRTLWIFTGQRNNNNIWSIYARSVARRQTIFCI